MRMMYIYKQLLAEEVKNNNSAVIEICKDIKECYRMISQIIRKCNMIEYNWSEDEIKANDEHIEKMFADNWGGI